LSAISVGVGIGVMVGEPRAGGRYAPPMHEVRRVATADGTSLLERHWPAEPSPADAWARMLLVHGLAEHSGRYEHVGRGFAAAGLDVHAPDMRGFGESGGQRAFVRRWSDYHDDLATLLIDLRGRCPGRPVVLFGHSMGGLVALGYVLGDRPSPDLLVLSAPAIHATVPAWKRAPARLLSRVVPATMLANGLDGADLAADPDVGRAYFADRLNEHRSTVRLAAEGFAEQVRVRRRLHRLGVPTFVYRGTADRIVPAAASEALDGLGGVVRRAYPGLRHEVHNEADWPAVSAEIVAWLREHC
jgi:alpha-beta hydrolase superfamily lysophospholipase